MEILRNIVLGIMSLAAICVWGYGFASVVSFIRLLMKKGGIVWENLLESLELEYWVYLLDPLFMGFWEVMLTV